MTRPTLPPSAVKALMDHLDLHLDTLQSGFPTSTRPNEPPLTVSQKREKIANTLERDPALFLSKWGSVLLYPWPTSATEVPSTSQSDSASALPSSLVAAGGGSSGSSRREAPADQQVPQQPTETSPWPPQPLPSSSTCLNALAHLQRMREMLDLFRPLATDYEVQTHLQKLDRQWAQLYERELFRQRRQAAHQDRHHHPQQHHASTAATTDQEQLLAWSTVSETTRKNRRLNFLLKTLAPPDPSVAGSGAAAVGAMRGESAAAATSSTAMLSGGSGGGGVAGVHAYRRSSLDPTNSSSPPTAATRISLAQMTSLSGSLANLSFAESTYFSDAEMEARAPELYQQYIGRYLDQDDDSEEEDEQMEEEEEEEEEEEGEEVEENMASQRQRHMGSQRTPATFDESMGLVDRVLWNIDHPTRKQLKQQREERREQEQKDKENEEKKKEEDGAKKSSSVSRPPPPPPQQPQRAGGNQDDDSDDFEEEFDTESEVEDEAEMLPAADDIEQDEAAAAAERAATRKLLHDMSMTPELPSQSRTDTAAPSSSSSMLSSTMSSAASTLVQPEARAMLAQVANGNDGGDDASEDESYLTRKEHQEALRQEFVLLMKQRFIDGLDDTFDYSTVDYDEDLDDLEQQAHDDEDRWFDDEEGEMVIDSEKPPPSVSSQGVRGSARWDYEARMRETPKNMDDYDY